MITGQIDPAGSQHIDHGRIVTRIEVISATRSRREGRGLGDAQPSLLVRQFVREFLTARPEATAGWRIGRTRQIPLEHDSAAAALLLRIR
jgi:hypothetical protein